MLHILSLTDFIITGRGRPIDMKTTTSTAEVTQDNFPSAEEAAQLYTQEIGGVLSEPRPFAQSPFTSEQEENRADALFFENINHDISALLNHAVNRNYEPFKNALVCMIDMTRRICA